MQEITREQRFFFWKKRKSKGLFLLTKASLVGIQLNEKQPT